MASKGREVKLQMADFSGNVLVIYAFLRGRMRQNVKYCSRSSFSTFNLLLYFMMKISSQTQFKKLEQPFNIFPAYAAVPNSFGGKKYRGFAFYIFA